MQGVKSKENKIASERDKDTPFFIVELGSKLTNWQKVFCFQRDERMVTVTKMHMHEFCEVGTCEYLM